MIWYAVDYSTATGPGSYTAYDSFAAALAATAGYAIPGVVWGSITSDFNEDDAQDFVSIYKDGPTWSWAYSIAGVTVFTSKLGFQTANDALANLNAIPNLPQRFTGDMIITANNPADLVAAARCWSCLSGKSVRMAVRLWLLCQWAKTKV